MIAEIYLGLGEQDKKLLRQAHVMKVKFGPDLIKNIVCEYFNLTYTEIESHNREKEIVYPRQVAMYLLRHHSQLSLKNIGELFSNRDHSTVIYADRHIQDLIDTEYKVREQIIELRELINKK